MSPGLKGQSWGDNRIEGGNPGVTTGLRGRAGVAPTPGRWRGRASRMTTIYIDSRKRVAGADSDFEVDLGESLHLRRQARRVQDPPGGQLPVDRPRPLSLFGRRRARHAQLGAAAGGRPPGRGWPPGFPATLPRRRTARPQTASV